MIDPNDQKTLEMLLVQKNTEIEPRGRGRPSTGTALSNAERQRRYREKSKRNVTKNVDELNARIRELETQVKQLTKRAKAAEHELSLRQQSPAPPGKKPRTPAQKPGTKRTTKKHKTTWQIDELRAIATEWRATNEKPTGVVLIYAGSVYGWKNVLRDAGHDQPGAYAVDADGHVFITEGGNDYDGAKCWTVVS